MTEEAVISVLSGHHAHRLQADDLQHLNALHASVEQRHNRMGDFRDAPATGNQRQWGLLEADCLLVLDRRHARDRPEVPVEGR